ncbi:MAG: arabinogalactan endo-1,4-beta-galactosidase [Bacteroidia bacterium]|nr:arabinogalactan endo-1,4-beta-galactosidase [Bacteroidia bacterium]
MKPYIFFLFIIALSCSNPEIDSIDIPSESEPIFYKGMDLSFQTELEDYNVEYFDENGNPVTLLEFLEENGTNLVRLKLWHTSQDGENTLSDVKSYAARIKAKNMSFLLNFHYSDYWTDPGKQFPPAAWENMSFEEVKVAIYDYTKDVVRQLKDQNTLPEIIQIGNETDSGFLWNFGKVWDDFDDNWPNYSSLVSEAIRAIREVDSDNSISIMLHHSSVSNAIYFFNELKPFNLDFDMIGLSYYPQLHTKDLNLVQLKLNELATTFNKDILMVEVAYPFTFNWDDNSTNFIGDSSQILTEFPATPQGQKAYFEWLVQTIKNIPNNRGKGFCYWAPDWVAFIGNEITSTSGSAWENQCIFDFDHKALPVIDVFRAN